MKCSSCNQEGHNKRSCKVTTTSVSELTVDTTPDVNAILPAKDELVDIPPWYKIQEIRKETFLSLVKALYDILEGKKLSKSEPDVFAQEVWKSFYNMTSETWEDEHKKIRIERAWTMALGDFHQALMGAFAGWKNYGRGHATGCDIGKEDDTCVAEVKNNTNTMNSGSKESVLNKLKKQRDLGKRALLIVVNGETAHSVKDGIETISGKRFYEELSGRPNFMDDLLVTLNQAVFHYKTFDTLKAALGTS